MSPTSRSLAELRKLGYLAEVVEKKIPRGFISKDLFGFIDILAVKPGEPVLGIQATSRSNVNARIKKAVALPSCGIWLASGCVFEVWGWGLAGKVGKRKTYQLRRVLITQELLDERAVDSLPSVDDED